MHACMHASTYLLEVGVPRGLGVLLRGSLASAQRVAVPAAQLAVGRAALE